MSKKENVFDEAKKKINEIFRGNRVDVELQMGVLEEGVLAVLGDLHHAWCESQKTVKEQCKNQCKFGFTQKGWHDLIFCDSIKASYGTLWNETCLFQVKPEPHLRHIRNQESCTHFEKAEKLLEAKK